MRRILILAILIISTSFSLSSSIAIPKTTETHHSYSQNILMLETLQKTLKNDHSDTALSINTQEASITQIITNGYAWRDIGIINATFNMTSVYNVRVTTAQFDSSIVLVGVQERIQKTIGSTTYLYNYIHLFVVNTTNISIQGESADVDIQYIFTYNRTSEVSYYDRITDFDILFYTSDIIYLVYSNRERKTNPDYDTAHVYLVNITKTQNSWSAISEKELVIAEQGYVDCVGITNTNSGPVVGYVARNLSTLIITYWKIKAEFIELETGNRASNTYSLGNMIQDSWSTRIIYDSSNGGIFMFVSYKLSEGDSRISAFIYDQANKNVNIIGELLTTSDYGNFFEIYPDFKDLAVFLADVSSGFGRIILNMDGFTDYENYFLWASFTYDASLGLGTENIGVENVGSLEGKLVAVNENTTDSNAYVLWIDSDLGTQEISSASITENGGDVVLGQENYTIITKTATGSLDATISNEKILLVHISYDKNNLPRPWLAVGLKDSDRDGLGDFEETKVYSQDYPNLDPMAPDTDGDKLGDGAEVLIYGTSPIKSSTDTDGLTDYQEVAGINIPYIGIRKTDPLNPDTDNDGLSDSEEALGMSLVVPRKGKSILVYSDPLTNDTDSDGLSDYDEVVTGWTCTGQYANGTTFNFTVWSLPNTTDYDKDGLSDLNEKSIRSDPWFADTDFEGITDYWEIKNGTNPNKGDTDGDGLSDYIEIVQGINITDPISNTTKALRTSPTLWDTDGDGLSDGEEYYGFDTYFGHIQTNPLKNDTDGDGLTDSAELSGVIIGDTTYYTHPWLEDTDGDGLSDNMEIAIGSIPTINDTDGDGLNDGDEYYGLDIAGLGRRSTDPLNNDTDGDGLSDYEEAVVYRIDPTSNDTDSDGLGDYLEVEGWEVTVFIGTGPNASQKSYMVTSNPRVYDSDGDGLSDYLEYINGLNPQGNDTDGDGLFDSQELGISDPRDPDTDDDRLSDYEEVRGIYIQDMDAYVSTDPTKVDTDGDGLSDWDEYVGINVSGRIITTDPTKVDTDGDGLSDYEELMGINISGTIYYTDPWLVDTDNDTLNDKEEIKWKTNPLVNDTDGDSILDGVEVNGFQIEGVGYRNTNPLSNDTDGDGLSDYEEVFVLLIDPTDNDTDGDGLSDLLELRGWKINIVDENGKNIEIQVASDPKDYDTDNDGLDDRYEYILGSDPQSNDTDKDLLADPYEVSAGTYISQADSDGDGLLDGEEVRGINIEGIGFVRPDPLDSDSDDDGLSDYEEAIVYMTNPMDRDSDSDGLDDNIEVGGWDITVVFINGSTVRLHVTPSPLDRDSDGDDLDDYSEFYAFSNPMSNDSDLDGLSDYREFILRTNITNADSDLDGLSDYMEVNVGSNPFDPDTDDDGLSDKDEFYGIFVEGIGTVFTSLTNPDTDGDGINDYEEVILRHTDPTNPDSDGDTLSDYEELYEFMTDPRKNDTDEDLLLDSQEILGINVTGIGLIKTDPRNPDTDGDGLSDYKEVAGIKISIAGKDRMVYTNPTKVDTDGDGLSDYEEVYGVSIPNIGTVITDPTNPDTDGDGLLDGKEAKPADPKFASDPTKADTDGDGLSDYEELVVRGTIPTNKDSDSDGIPDGLDFVFPTFSDLFILVGIIAILGLLQARAYGMFRNWRKDILAFGLADSGGIPMFMVPEDFSSYDMNLISSGLLGIYSLTGELSGRELESLVLAGDMPIFISRGKHTLAFAFLRRQYPRLIKQLQKVHRDLEETYETILESWEGLEEDIEEVRSWVQTRLGLPSRIREAE